MSMAHQVAIDRLKRQVADQDGQITALAARLNEVEAELQRRKGGRPKAEAA